MIKTDITASKSSSKQNSRNIKTTILFCFIFFALTFKIEGQSYSLVFNDYWKFSSGDHIAAILEDFDDSQWKCISTKKYWETQGFENYDGYVWYRKKVIIPQKWEKVAKENGGLYFKYEFAADVDEVYFNGRWIGRMGEFPPSVKVNYQDVRKFKIPAELVRFGKENKLAIRVYDKGGYGGLKTEEISLSVITDIDNLHFEVKTDENIVFENNEKVSFTIIQKDSVVEDVSFNLVCEITTDDHSPIDTLIFPSVSRKGVGFEKFVSFVPPHPGFYRICVYAERHNVKSDLLKFNVGANVSDITYSVNPPADFDSFWTETLNELQKVDPRYKATLIPEKSEGTKNIYHIEMYSLGNVKIEGYYAVPKKGEGKYPVIVSFLGYGSGGAYPNPGNNPAFCELILSTRGQGIQKSDNTYGEWITSGLESKETYYYRGAYMDLVRSLDFLCSREEIDTTKIFAEGGSQGGAFTMALCALDHRVAAAAPYIPFMSDFSEYFSIVPWPREVIEYYMLKNKELDWAHVYNVLSYFDMKNLAEKIQCPIIMGVGLQDNTCPPRTNFAGYSQIISSKKYYIYPEAGHTVGKNWWGIKDKFFRSFLKE